MKDVEAAARALGVQLHAVGGAKPDELDGAFAAMAKQRAQALIVPPDSSPFAHARQRIVDLAAKHRLPGDATSHESLPRPAASCPTGRMLADMFRRAATYVDKILKGAKPGDLPVEQPTKFELVINLKTAKALGLTIPPSLLPRADQVIE